MKPFVYEEIVSDAAAAKTLQLEATPEGEIVIRTIAGNGKGKSQKIAKLADAPNDPHIELIKKTFEDPAANGATLETQLNEAYEKLKRPKVRWLKDAAPAPPDADPAAK